MAQEHGDQKQMGHWTEWWKCPPRTTCENTLW